MQQELKDRLLKFVASVYAMEPLDDEFNETPLAYEALELMDLLEQEGAKEYPTNFRT